MSIIAWVGFIYSVLGIIACLIETFIEKKISTRVCYFINFVICILLVYFFFNYLFH